MAQPDPASATSPPPTSALPTPASLPSPQRSSFRAEIQASTAKEPITSHHALNPGHSRRPSSGSLSSHRQSLLTPPLSVEASSPVPQRLPRQPSTDLAELHNELEVEQEAAVNRLLKMIRDQQLQNQQLATDETSSVAATADSSSVRARSPGVSVCNAGLSRQNSFTNRRSASRASSTHASSPSLQPMPFAGEGIGAHGGEWFLAGSRDEASFYMAEAQMLSRENEMMKRRIRELERQLVEVRKAKAQEESNKADTTSRSSEVEDTSAHGDNDSSMAISSSGE